VNESQNLPSVRASAVCLPDGIDSTSYCLKQNGVDFTPPFPVEFNEMPSQANPGDTNFEGRAIALKPVVWNAFREWPKPSSVQHEFESPCEEELVESFKMLRDKAWHELTAEQMQMLWYVSPLMSKGVATYLLPAYLLHVLSPFCRGDSFIVVDMVAAPGKKGTVNIVINDEVLNGEQKSAIAAVLEWISQRDFQDKPKAQRRITRIIDVLAPR